VKGNLVVNVLLKLLLYLVDAVSAFWQNHSGEFPSLSVLQSSISDIRRRLTSPSSADVRQVSAAVEQRDSSSVGSDDVN